VDRGRYELEHDDAVGRADEHEDATLKSVSPGCLLLVKHAIPAQCIFECLGGSVDQEGL
jgi:hypothetical protein